MLPNKAKWQEYKTLYGIPDGLSSIKMGDRFEAWRKAEGTLRDQRDYKGCLAQIELLVKDMATYAKALKDAAPAKFKGKTPAEKEKNYKDANAKFKEIFGELSAAKAQYSTLAKPLEGVQLALKKAEAAFSKLKSTSSQTDFGSFYSEAFRGIALPLQLLNQVNTDPGIKRGIVGFKSHANLVNDMLGTAKTPFKASDIYGHIATALQLLGNEVAGKR